MSAVSEDGLVILLARLERAASDRDRAMRAETALERERDFLRKTLDVSQEGNRRYLKDIDAAKAKIAEWAEYASQLRAAINAIDPRAIKRKTIVLPDMPAPFETEIPF